MKTKEFLEKLSKTAEYFNREWVTGFSDTAVRMYPNIEPDYFSYCPITAVCYMETQREYDVWDQHLAGKVLGLSRKQVDNISIAADYNNENGEPKLRAKILEATSPRKGPNAIIWE